MAKRIATSMMVEGGELAAMPQGDLGRYLGDTLIGEMRSIAPARQLCPRIGHFRGEAGRPRKAAITLMPCGEHQATSSLANVTALGSP
jgi:hypothetical protein